MKDVIFIQSILIWVMAFGDTGDLHRTGPSYCTIKIVPVAYSDGGAILFKTYFQINTSGGDILVPKDLGWLVVSSSGIWEEKRHVHLEFDGGVQITPQDSACLREFDYPFDFSRPLPSVQPLLKRYGINKPIKPDAGKGQILWTSDKKGTIGKFANTQLKSLNGIQSQEGNGTPVKASFFFKGVALFHCEEKASDTDDSTSVRGPVFLKDVLFEDQPVWIGDYYIDAIAIVK